MRKEGALLGGILSVSLFMVFIVFLSVAEAYLLPDSGQITCYSARGRLMDCPKAWGKSAQDGSYTINPPSYTDNNDGTITDHNTKLMWQKQAYGPLTNWNNVPNYCSGLTLGGYSDWRLPTKMELASIVDYGRYSPAIDTYFFNDSNYTSADSFWSDTPLEGSADGSLVWQVDFSAGATTAIDVSSTEYVRCVRGQTLRTGDFIDNGDGTITDWATGLMWQQAEGGSMKWSDALNYCESLATAGHSDWRLPNVRELDSITDDTYVPAVDVRYFPAASSAAYWTATSYVGYPKNAWAVVFSGGYTWYDYDKSGQNSVRCVREGRTVPEVGKITLSIENIAFGIVTAANTATKTLAVSNTGSASVGVGPVSLPSAPFSILSDTCSNTSIPPSGNCSLSVIFAPAAEGVFEDSISLSTTDDEHKDITIAINGSTSFRFPDTGFSVCSDGENPVDCSPPGDPLAQDGSYSINPPSYTVIGDGTVMDNNTGLMWQQEDDPQSYNWYEASGTYHKRYNKYTFDYCGSLTLGGYTDWRLPTSDELNGLKLYGSSAYSPDAFPNSIGYYWYADHSPSSSEAYVKCVRGDTHPYRDFVNNGNGTITDNGTKLMWEQSAPRKSWTEALAWCESLALAGYSDWRLANIKELETLVDRTRSRPALNTSFFPEDLSSYDYLFFWSSTPLLGSGDAWYVDFVNGSKASSISLSTALGCGMIVKCGEFARCVRNSSNTIIPALILTITSPSDNATVTSSPVTIAGTITSESSVTVNGSQASVSNGTFVASISLHEGLNTITATASDQYGQTDTQSITITLLTGGEISGAVTDSYTRLALSRATVSVVDSSNAVHTTSTADDGAYSFTDISPGSFTETVGKDGYASSGTEGIVYAGQTTIADVQLTPITPVISGINVSGITTESAVIAWTTDQPSDSWIEYGTTAAYGSFANDATFTTSHSITLENLSSAVPCHFRIRATNGYGISATTGDNVFTTLQFSVKTLGDYGNVTVMEVKGNYDSNDPDGTINYLPRQEIARAFIKNHTDDYDFMIIFSNFDFAMPEAEAKAFYLDVKNDVHGIGKAVFDDSASYGSKKLQGMIDMGNISNKVSDPADPRFEDTLATLAHEQMHRWGASVKFKESSGNISTALLGKDGAHWSYLLDSDASVMYGNDWQNNGDGTFTSTGKEGYYSALDLYLAGFYGRSQVPPMLLIDNPLIDPARLPEVGTTIQGNAASVTIDDIIAAEGDRIPDVSTSQKTFRTAFILITAPNTFTGNELPGIENVRSGWAGKFARLTGGKGSIPDVAPDITIVVTSPSNGSTITRPDVTVKGAVINTTGNETGVTVNGIVANVYGNQFVANHVPLTEGSNALTITATDLAGTTASTEVSVYAVAGDYIRLTSNIESGITPLEVTLRIDGSFSIEDADLSIEGPTVAEVVDNPAPDEYRVEFTAEGIYYITASAAGPDGNVYEDTIAVTVINKEQLDRLLKAKWEGMKGALAGRSIELAVSDFLSSSQEKYRGIFTFLLDQLPNIAINMKPIEEVYLEGDVAQYRIKRQEDVGEVTYYIYFAIDGDGIWKIQQF